MKTAMIIGVFNDSHYWLKATKKLGYRIISTHPMDIKEKGYYKDVKEHINELYVVSYFDFDKILDIAKNHNVSLVITHPCSNDATIASGYVNTHMNLKGVSYKSALMAANKYEFHKFLENNDLPRPSFTKLKGDGDLTFPCIVKPNYGAGSVGVKLINNYEELSSFFNNKNTLDGYQLTKPKYDFYIIQEYVDAPKIMGCHAVVHNGELIIFANTYRDLIKERDAQPYFYGQEFITNRKPITEYTLSQINKLVKAIGIDNTPFDLEIMLDENDNAVSFIELNLRPAELGFNYINGRDGCEYCIGEQVKLGTDLECDFSEIPDVENYIGIRYFRFNPGKIKSISWPKLPNNTIFFKTNLKDGSTIGSIWNVNTAYNNGSLGLIANSKDAAIDNIDKFIKGVKIEYADM